MLHQVAPYDVIHRRKYKFDSTRLDESDRMVKPCFVGDNTREGNIHSVTCGQQTQDELVMVEDIHLAEAQNFFSRLTNFDE